MELDDIRRKAAAARQFTHEVGGASFTLRAPTKIESSVLYTRVAVVDGGSDRAAMIRWQRAMLLQAIVGWSGVMLRHVLPDADGSVMAFEPGAAEVLLDAQPDWEESLTAALLDHLAKRRAVEDTAAKN